MAIYAKRICAKQFTGTESIDTYLKACKWIANKFVANEEVSNKLSYSINKNYKNGIYIYDVVVYLNLNESEIRKQHCEICKETHNAFFLNNAADCNNCKLNAYQRRIDSKLKIIKSYVKEKIVK